MKEHVPTPPVLVFATRNRGKVAELRELLADLPIRVLSLDELDRPISEIPEVVEDGDTFLANATKKAQEISQAIRYPALADDSGLEVDALGGAPGVISARYAGEGATDQENNAKLLAAMHDIPEGERGARFRACLVLADVYGPLGDRVLSAEGSCPGRILSTPRGSGGFGYDPLFYVPELGATFAELGVGTKNNLSHRARAMAAMKAQIVSYFSLAKEADSR